MGKQQEFQSLSFVGQIPASPSAGYEIIRPAHEDLFRLRWSRPVLIVAERYGAAPPLEATSFHSEASHNKVSDVLPLHAIAVHGSRSCSLPGMQTTLPELLAALLRFGRM